MADPSPIAVTARPSSQFVFRQPPVGDFVQGVSRHLAFFLLTVMLIVSRRPDVLFHPQFFAEDGTIWFAEAYDIGWWHSLFTPHTGYIQTLPRLAAGLALLVPLQWAPLMMNAVGILVQALPVTFLLSSRCTRLGSLSTRALLAAAYIALPNSTELQVSVTEAQWHLALLATLVVISSRPTTLAWRVHDSLVILLCATTGPFCLVIVIVGAGFWAVGRETWRLRYLLAFAAASSVQVWALLTTGQGDRSPQALGASVPLFVRLVGSDVFLGELIGGNMIASHHGSLVLITLLFLLASALVVYCGWKANWEFRAVLLVSLLVFAASLRTPMASLTGLQWESLTTAPPGIRYWFFPMIAFQWSIIWCLRQSPSRLMKSLALAAALTSLYGCEHDWRYPPAVELNFEANALRFETAPTGTVMDIPILPGGAWTAHLVKRAEIGRVPEHVGHP